MFLAFGGNAVKLGALFLLCLRPLGNDPSLPLHTMEGRVKRASLYLQNIPGLRANRLADAVAMLRAPLQRLKNEHVERSLQKLNPVQVWLAC